MTEQPDHRPETLAAQMLHRIDRQTGGVIPPIQPSTTFVRDAESYSLTLPGRGYSRDANMTGDPAEALIARLEGGPEALLFGSGMAAATAVFLALRPGDHIVAPRVMYWGLRSWLVEFCPTWGLGLDLFDSDDPAALAAAIRPGETKLIWVESPCNPTWSVIDLAAAAEAAHRAGALLAVDSTVASPVLTRPIEHGADLVFHSATKYLNGHSDVVAGALIPARADEHWARIRKVRAEAGAILGPFEAWLLQRGLRTLFLRVRRASESALTIARHFERHPVVERVLYPGLESHPGHAVAARQMTGGFGGMLSIRVKDRPGDGPDTGAAALAVAKRCRLFTRATSLGGVESLIEHRGTIEGPTSPIPQDLLRISVGIEHPDDLIADLEQALAG